MKLSAVFAVLAFAAVARADYGVTTTTTTTITTPNPTSTPCTTTDVTPTMPPAVSTVLAEPPASTPTPESTPCTTEDGTPTPSEPAESTPCDTTPAGTPTGTVEGEGPNSTPCEQETTPSYPEDDEYHTTPVPTSTPTGIYNYAAFQSESGSGGFSTGGIVGVSVAGIAAVGAVAGTVFYINKVRKVGNASMA
ncbi:hypothetical protein BJ742DRAFT_856030 [Cladochytrium replicatum]|nr:hypothetical protein BJ742DRAFT_856030 [Cladochytrium replicatum]